MIFFYSFEKMFKLLFMKQKNRKTKQKNKNKKERK